MISIGIDLGTTFSSVAVYDRETLSAKLITDETGSAVMPSVVSFDPQSKSVLVGSMAKGNLLLNPGSSVTEVKRELGKTFGDAGPLDFPDSETDVWFTASDDYRIRFAGEWLSAEEISGFIIQYLKNAAERSLGSPVQNAVIAIPAYYKRREEDAIRKSRLAGLIDISLISEPIAAALAYAADHPAEAPRLCLVFRVGGGSADASIVRIAGSSIEIQAVEGETEVGGAAFDDRVAGWAACQIKSRFGTDVRRNRRAWFELKTEAERAKLRLGVEASATLYLVNAVPGTPVSLEISRAEFQELIAPLVTQLMPMVSRALEGAAARGISASDVAQILLVGGATYVPLVRTKLAELLGKPASAFVGVPDPDTCIARGAALRAGTALDAAGAAQVSNDDGRSGAHDPKDEAPATAAERRFNRLLNPEYESKSSDEFGPLPARPPRVFLCHAAEDKPAVRQLYSRLMKHGVQPWLDEKNLLPGQDWRREISIAMRDCDVVLVCLSQSSVGKTGYVQKEIREALEIAELQPDGTIFLIPARLNECPVPGSLERLHRVDLFAPDGYGLLVRALRIRSELN